jgi:hypothetical protein
MLTILTGYDKAAQPVQVLPRVVTKIPKPVITVALTETAMACLLESYDVLCFAHDRQFRIKYVPVLNGRPSYQPLLQLSYRGVPVRDRAVPAAAECLDHEAHCLRRRLRRALG